MIGCQPCFFLREVVPGVVTRNVPGFCYAKQSRSLFREAVMAVVFGSAPLFSRSLRWRFVQTGSHSRFNPPFFTFFSDSIRGSLPQEYCLRTCLGGFSTIPSLPLSGSQRCTFLPYLCEECFREKNKMKKGSEKGRAFLCSSEEQAVRCIGTTTVNMQCCRILEI